MLKSKILVFKKNEKCGLKCDKTFGQNMIKHFVKKFI